MWLHLWHPQRLWALEENATESAWPRRVGWVSANVGTKRDPERSVWGGEVGSLQELNRSSQTAGVSAQEKDSNNSQRNAALHNRTRLRLLSDKPGSTLEEYERLTDKQGRG